MKILYPVEVFYPSQAGGPANSVYWIAKNLAAEGLAPEVVASDKGLGAATPRDEWTSVDGIRAVYVRTPNLNFPLKQTLAAFRRIFGSDIVHISSIFYPTAFASGIVARLLRKKLLWSPRGELDPIALEHSKNRKKPVLALLRLLVGRYPVYHSTCDEETAYIRDVFGSDARVEQIPNYLEIPSQATRTPADYILFIGRIHPKKAIDNLIEAVSRSRRFMDSGFELRIAGTGKPEFEEPLRDMVARLGLESVVRFVGQVEGTEKQELLASARFMVMPSHTENFGVVVLESLAQGTPVIASRGAPWKILEDEDLGVWSENSPEALAAAIDGMLSLEPERYEDIRSRCRPFVEREFDIRENISKWLELYRSVAG